MNPQGKAYIDALKEVYKNPEYILEDSGPEINQQGCFERLNYRIKIHRPTREPVLTGYEPRDKVIREYTEKERELFDKGDIINMETISRFWNKIKNPDGTINANYGYMVYYIKDAGNPTYNVGQEFISQWEWAKMCLINKTDTAQAYMHFNRTKDQWAGNKDQPCCMYSIFLIRDNELNYHVNMRSNDLWFGTPYNLAYHIELMYRMREEILDFYPGLEIGYLSLSSDSTHIYRRHIEKVKELLENLN